MSIYEIPDPSPEEHRSYYRPGGGLREQSFFRKDHLIGERKLYNENGKLYRHEIYQNRRHSRKDKKSPITLMLREVKHYYKTGQLHGHDFYYDGEDEGEHKLWYPNGQLCSSKFYHKGKRDGITTTYSDDGIMISLTRYSKGELHGMYKLWHRNGYIYEYVYFCNGKREGQHKTYNTDGSIYMHSYFYHDCRIAYLTVRKVMALLYFKNRLRIKLRQKIVNRLTEQPQRIPLIPSHIIAGYCI
jgi:antitoxin component YwqK of YwqJK toxin-antitoxin module